MTELSIILQKQTLSQYSFVCCLLAPLLTLLCVLYNHYCPYFLPDVKHVQVVSNNKAKACLAVQHSGAKCILEMGSQILTLFPSAQKHHHCSRCHRRMKQIWPAASQIISSEPLYEEGKGPVSPSWPRLSQEVLSTDTLCYCQPKGESSWVFVGEETVTETRGNSFLGELNAFYNLLQTHLWMPPVTERKYCHFVLVQQAPCRVIASCSVLWWEGNCAAATHKAQL